MKKRSVSHRKLEIRETKENGSEIWEMHTVIWATREKPSSSMKRRSGSFRRLEIDEAKAHYLIILVMLSRRKKDTKMRWRAISWPGIYTPR